MRFRSLPIHTPTAPVSAPLRTILTLGAVWAVLAASAAPAAPAASAAAGRMVRTRPVAAGEAVRIAPAGAAPRTTRVPCEVGNTNAPVYALEDWIWGEESYYHLTRPGATCDLGGDFRLVEVSIFLDFQAQDLPATFRMSAGLHQAVLTPGCWIPGMELCRSAEAEFTIPAPGAYQLIIPVDAGFCQADAARPYFLAVHIPDAFDALKRPAAVSDDEPFGCRSYNDYGNGPEDVVTEYGWPGEILLAAVIESAAGERPAPAELAAHWAPVVHQDTGATPRHDHLTRFDFDGDWNAWNNFESLSAGTPLPGCVYWSVVESETHWWLTYGFFHPYDSSTLGKDCDLHENDFEGVTLTIRRTGGEFGLLRTMATMAHGQVFYFTPPGSDVVIGGSYQYLSTSPNRLDNGLGCPEAGIGLPWDFTTPDSTLNLVPSPGDGSLRPAVFIEAGGHGVGRLSRALEGGTAIPIGGGSYDFYDDDGVVYYHDGGPAEVPTILPGAQEIRYELRPLAELWERRDDLAADGTYCGTEDYLGSRGCELSGLAVSFGGDCLGVGGGCAAAPPWGWEADAAGLPRGEWFLDPAVATAAHLSDLPDRALAGYDAYLSNIFLQGDHWIHLTEPSGPVTWSVGQLVHLGWEMSPPGGQGAAPSLVNLAISRDGGSWETIAYHLDAAAGGHDWTVTGTDNAVCRLRLDAATDCVLHILDEPAFDVTVPTALRFFTAERRADGAHLRWAFAAGLEGRWRLHRATAGAARSPVTGAVFAAAATGGFVDPAPPSGPAEYWLHDEDGLAGGIWLGPARLPAATSPAAGPHLEAVWPNPFNPGTTVRFQLPRAGRVLLSIHDLRGRRVAVIHEGPLPAGAHELAWDGRGSGGAPVEAGVYVVRLATGQAISTRKILLLK